MHFHKGMPNASSLLGESNRCCWCDVETTLSQKRRKKLQLHAATVEHLVPKYHGGGEDRANLAISCLRCNRLRGDNLGPPSLPPADLKGWASKAWREGTPWATAKRNV